MSDSDLCPSLGRLVDQACNRFEESWRAVLRKDPGWVAPRIEEFLNPLEPPARPSALRELLALDIFYRRKLGEQPTADEYRIRFADLDGALLAELLREAGGVGSTAHSTVNFPAKETRISAAKPGQRVSYFGDYELLAEIAQGGMGVVFKARQVSLNRMVALKMIRAGEFASAAEVQRFRQEAESAANLDHPHIVPIYEVGEHEGQHYYAMKLIEGGSLAQARDAWCLQPGLDRAEVRRRQERIARLLIAVARAVHHAHQRGILHRDLKPANILIDTAGEPHVTDFGLAKKAEGDSAMTQSGAIVGTPSYMSPEQANGAKVITTQADVYGLGAVLYELLTGRPPFKAETPADTLIEVRHQDPPRPSSLLPAVDRDLETICLKCLAKDAGRRYGSAEALAEDLGRWQMAEPIEARPTGSLERTVKWVRRHPSPVAASTFVLLTLIAGIIGTSWGLLSALDHSAKADKARKEMGEARDDADRLAKKEKEARDEAERLAKKEKEARDEAERLAKKEKEARKLMEAHLALERARADFDRDNVASGLHWLVRGLEAVPAKELDLEHAFRVLLAGWNREIHPCQQITVLPLEIASAEAAPPRTTLLAETSDGKIQAGLVQSKDGTFVGVDLWNSETGKLLGPLISSFQPGFQIRAAFTPDSKLLLLGGVGPDMERYRLRWWDVATRKLVGEAKGIPDSALFFPEIPVTAFLSPDGKRLATIFAVEGFDETRVLPLIGVQLWEFPSGKPIGKPLPTNGVAHFSPDGRILLTASRKSKTDAEECEIHLWSAETATPIRPPIDNKKAIVQSAAFSPDGQAFAVGGYSVNDHEGEEGFLTIRRTATADIVASIVFEVPRGEGFMSRAVRRVAYSPDGKFLLVHSGSVQLFKVSRLFGLVRHGGMLIGDDDPAKGPVSVHQFSLDGKTMLVTSGRKLRLYQTSTGEPIGEPFYLGETRTELQPQDKGIQRFARQFQGVRWAAFGQDGKSVLIAKGDKLLRFGLNFRPPKSMQLSADTRDYLPIGQQYKLNEDEDVVELWDSVDSQGRVNKKIGEPLTYGKGKDIKRPVCSPDGRTLLTLGNYARLWNAATHKPIGQIIRFPEYISPPKVAGQKVRAQPAKPAVQTFAFSPDGKTVFLADGNTGLLYTTGTGKAVGKPIIHQIPIWAAAFSPDSNRLVTGTREFIFPHAQNDLLEHYRDEVYSVQIWDAETGEPIGKPMKRSCREWLDRDRKRWGGEFSIAVSPDQSKIIGCFGGTHVHWWDAEMGQTLRQSPPLEPETSLYFSPALRVFWGSEWAKDPMTKTMVQKFRLWDISADKPRGPYLEKFLSPFGAASFSPDRRLFATSINSELGLNLKGSKVQLWNTVTRMSLGRPFGNVDGASFSPDGRQLLLTDPQSPAQRQSLFEVPQPVSGRPEYLRLWIEVATATEQGTGGEVTELDQKTWQERHDHLQKLGGPPKMD